MLADQVARYMQGLVNDPDNVSFPPSLRATYLQVAYDEFRGMCPEEFFEVSFQPTALTNVYSADLSGTIFGPPPAAWVALTPFALNATVTNNTRVYRATRGGISGAAPGPTGTGTGIVDGTVVWAFVPQAQRLTRVLWVDATTGALLGTLTPAASFAALRQVPSLGAASLASQGYSTRWFLDGRILRFSVPVTGTLQIWFTPQQDINWPAAIASGSGIYLDDLTQFHDVIGLIAAQQYYAAQGQGNAALQAQFERRVRKMEEFFAESRSGIASRSVTDVGGSYGW